MTTSIKQQHSQPLDPLQLTDLTALDSPPTTNSVEDDEIRINHHNNHQIKVEIHNKNDSQILIHHQHERKIVDDNNHYKIKIERDVMKTDNDSDVRITTTINGTNITTPNTTTISETSTTITRQNNHNRSLDNDSNNNLSQQHHSRTIQTNKLTDLQTDQLKSLIKIIRQGDYKDFIELLESGGFKNLLNVFIEGQTALHYSLIYGRSLAWCKQLVLNGANPNLTNLAGWHPIHLAAFNGSRETMRYLIDCIAY